MSLVFLFVALMIVWLQFVKSVKDYLFYIDAPTGKVHFTKVVSWLYVILYLIITGSLLN